MPDPIPAALHDLSVESTNHDELRSMFRKQVEHALEGDLRALLASPLPGVPEAAAWALARIAGVDR